MKGTIIKGHDDEIIWITGMELIQEYLEAITVEVGHLQEEAVTTDRLHCSIHIVVVKLVLHFLYGLHSLDGDTSSDDGHQTKTTLILNEDTDG